MKLDLRRLPAFLRDPGDIRIVLLHGENEGAIRHRADALTHAIVGQADDIFRVAWLAREDHVRLQEEAHAIAMGGGRRVIRVREATDALVPMVRQISEGEGDTLVILEGGEMPPRAKLRTLVEQIENGVAIACYPEDGAALRTAASIALSEAGVGIERDAMDWLVQHLGGDRAQTRSELEKLVLYASDGKELDLDAVRVCVGQQGAVSFDDALFAATAGDASLTDQALGVALGEGLATVAAARGVLAHLARLYMARAEMEQGRSANDVMKGVRPPVFFKRADAFLRALQHWSAPQLLRAMEAVRQTEFACKQTGAADTLLIRRLLFQIARHASGLSRTS